MSHPYLPSLTSRPSSAASPRSPSSSCKVSGAGIADVARVRPVPSLSDSGAAPPAWATLMVATCNTLNLALPRRVTYANQAPMGADDYDRKLGWLGGQLARLNADIVGLQEVWDETALREAVARSGLRYGLVSAPGAEHGAIGTPRVALVTRLAVDDIRSVSDFDEARPIAVPDIGPATHFERPVLHARLHMKHGQGLHFT